MLKDAHEMLRKLGLKEADVQVYLACLENKQGLFVAEIAKLTGIKRSTVNLILERLQERGFVTFHLEGARKLFSAEAPESLLFNFEEQVKDLRGFIPLLRMASGGDKITKIRFFEGKEGVEKIYTDTLLTLKISKDSKKELLAISSGEDVFNVIPHHEKQFINKRVKERIPIRWIAPEGRISRELDKTSAQEFRKMRFFDGKKYQFHIGHVIINTEKPLIVLQDMVAEDSKLRKTLEPQNGNGNKQLLKASYSKSSIMCPW